MYIPRTVVVIILLAVILRIGGLSASLLISGPEKLVYGDAVGYVELSKNLVEGAGFTNTLQGQRVVELFRTPGLPLVLAPFAQLSAGVVWYAIALSVLAGVFLPLFTYLLSVRWFGERAGYIAAGLAAFEPHLVFFSWLPLTEVPFLLFALGGMVALAQGWDKRAWLWSALGGTLIGYSLLIRPGFLSVVILAFFTTGMWVYMSRRREQMLQIVVAFVLASLVVAPWMMRNHSLTGAWALSGAGWRNVFTDYLASVRALDNSTSFSEEKRILKDVDAAAYGLSREDINNPKNAALLRSIALPELWERRGTVLRLESYLLVSYFMQDGYYYQFLRFGFIDGTAGEKYSASFALLSQGLRGIPTVLGELKRQYFIPLFGRLFTIGIAALALLGAWYSRRTPATYLLLGLIGLSALTATAIGLGVEARLRLPVEPFIFMLAGAALARIYTWYENRHLHSRT